MAKFGVRVIFLLDLPYRYCIPISELPVKRKIMKIDGIKKVLENACKKAGGQRAWGRQHGISPAYICETLAERREVGEKILKALGYKSTVFYQKDKP
jgi:hypothetical protein